MHLVGYLYENKVLLRYFWILVGMQDVRWDKSGVEAAEGDELDQNEMCRLCGSVGNKRI
jgi:hypothetical protein